jgi:hypothetical protein
LLQRAERGTDELIEGVDLLHDRICAAYRGLFGLIAEMDRRELWRDSGARDMARWLWMRYGLSEWKAHRWIACAHALQGLPHISEAFASGRARRGQGGGAHPVWPRPRQKAR